jgi:hypothetical protein
MHYPLLSGGMQSVDAPGEPSSKRQHERYLLPVHGSPIDAFLWVTGADEAESSKGQVWDISASGIRVALHGAPRLEAPSKGTLRVVEPINGSQIELAVELRWIRLQDDTLFAGLSLLDGTLPEDCFLWSFMPRSWVDMLPTTNIHPLFPPDIEQTG